MKAAEQLAAQGIDSDVYSVTSWSELAREGVACEKCELSSGTKREIPFVTQQLTTSQGPIIAATDYVRGVPESIRAFVPNGRRYVTLGTDGFGRSDTRAALRAFFNVDAASIVKTVLSTLSMCSK
jgi:pyruvate dehydrogenase E1 component